MRRGDQSLALRALQPGARAAQQREHELQSLLAATRLVHRLWPGVVHHLPRGCQLLARHAGTRQRVPRIEGGLVVVQDAGPPRRRPTLPTRPRALRRRAEPEGSLQGVQDDQRFRVGPLPRRLQLDLHRWPLRPSVCRLQTQLVHGREPVRVVRCGSRRAGRVRHEHS